MSNKDSSSNSTLEENAGLRKIATGIRGFDEISYGGIPEGRATLICGGPGCGKSLFAATVAATAAANGHAAAFLSFEERPEAILANAKSIGLDFAGLIEANHLVLRYVGPPADVAVEIGDYNLDGLLLRLELVLASGEVKLMVLDTIETLFGMFLNERTIRSELVRLFRWLQSRGVSLVITAEQGNKGLTRFGLEEYVTDCVVFLDHESAGDQSTRRLRIVKYRGTNHESNRFPFLISADGFTVLPITSARLDHSAVDEHVGTGQPQLDEAFGGSGVWKGSTVMLSGSSGTGKSIFSGQFVNDFCNRGGRACFVSFEESPGEIVRNLSVAGIGLQPHLDSGLLSIRAARPTMLGMEMHLVEIFKEVERQKPAVVVIDPITGFDAIADMGEVHRTLVRLIDLLKAQNITIWMTAAVSSRLELTSEFDLSSVVDSWMHVEQQLDDQAYGKVLRIVKARGLKHSRRLLPFEITSAGIYFEGDSLPERIVEELTDE